MAKKEKGFLDFIGLGADKPKPEDAPTGSGIAEEGKEAIIDARMKQKKALCEMAEGGYWNVETNKCMSQPPQEAESPPRR